MDVQGRVQRYKQSVLLERDKEHPPFVKLDVDDAMDFMIEKDFCNPHQLVRNIESSI